MGRIIWIFDLLRGYSWKHALSCSNGYMLTRLHLIMLNVFFAIKQAWVLLSQLSLKHIKFHVSLLNMTIIVLMCCDMLQPNLESSTLFKLMFLIMYCVFRHSVVLCNYAPRANYCWYGLGACAKFIHASAGINSLNIHTRLLHVLPVLVSGRP